MKKVLTAILVLAVLPLKLMFAGGMAQLKTDFTDSFRFQMGCITIEDDLEDGANCPVLTPGAEGSFKLIEAYDVDDFGTMNATTGTWDTDILLKTGTAWKTHDTEDDFAKVTSTGLEGSGQFETIVTLFYKGNKASRRNFFNDAFKKDIKFAIAIAANDGNTHVLEKCKMLPVYDSKLGTDTVPGGWAVTFKQKGDVPFLYTGAFI